MAKIEEEFPMKSIKVNENDKSWVDAELFKIDRKRKREYNLHKKSTKWRSLNMMFMERQEKLKHDYKKEVQNSDISEMH